MWAPPRPTNSPALLLMAASLLLAAPAPFLQAHLSKPTPDFAAALAIYTNGSNAFRPDGVTPRTM